MIKFNSVLIVLVLFPFFSNAKPVKNDCRSWPMNMAEVWLKNAKIIDIPDLDESKTEVKLLASEKKPHHLYTNVFRFVFHANDGRKFEVITQNVASDEECSISEVNTYLVSQSDINY
ncbi:hypothetical protein [Pantoea sp. A4]|uniref:hypothetical protein n=1 Tax=Pantoea sp. A4 TaxID=1225184 RepID=UPI00035CFAB6|nr:hypothetical protein [Pantoea sp. A4]